MFEVYFLGQISDIELVLQNQKLVLDKHHATS